jgi:putative oxidoreductase
MNVRQLFFPDKWPVDSGLLLLRLGFGLSMVIFHGYGKLTGGPETWERLGGMMQNFGIDFFPVFWGFMAMSAEFFGSIFLIFGVFVRPAAILLAMTMIVAAIRHLALPADADGAGFKGAAHALEFLAVYLTLYFTGPGKYNLFGLIKRN